MNSNHAEYFLCVITGLNFDCSKKFARLARGILIPTAVGLISYFNQGSYMTLHRQSGNTFSVFQSNLVHDSPQTMWTHFFGLSVELAPTVIHPSLREAPGDVHRDSSANREYYSIADIIEVYGASTEPQLSGSFACK